jgi:hypothetical protein
LVDMSLVASPDLGLVEELSDPWPAPVFDPGVTTGVDAFERNRTTMRMSAPGLGCVKTIVQVIREQD